MKFSLYKFIGLAILMIILFKVDLHAVSGHLKQTRFEILFAVLLLCILQIAIRAFRWRRMLARQGINCPLKDAFLYYFSCLYMGLITPGRVGEMIKALYLKQAGYANFSFSMSSV